MDHNNILPGESPKATNAPATNGATNGTTHAPTRLTPRHLADLRASGLSDKQIAACGFHSRSSPENVRRVLNWKRYESQLGECLAIPFFDAEGKPTGYVRLKPDNPRKGDDGKPIKYESPKGSSNRAYFPPDTRLTLTDSSVPLIVTEGEKKSAEADQEGFPCVGLVGVYGWQKKRAKGVDGKAQGERELIDDLTLIAWQGRQVFVCFDSDAATNSNVRWAEFHLAEALTRKGAIVRVIRLPAADPGPDGTPGKVGLDDFLVARGPDAFCKLCASATAPAPPEKGLTPNEGDDDPHRLARLYIGEHCQHADGVTLRHWRGEWHRWSGSAYRVLPKEELGAGLTLSAKAEMDRVNLIAQRLAAEDEPAPTVRKVTPRLTADVGHALQSLTVLPADIDAPAWIGVTGPFPATDYLSCRNGLIHLPCLVAGQAHFMPATPCFFSANCLDFAFDLEAAAPSAWLGFLAQLWPGDDESIRTLQEWMGYLLTPDTRQQKILMLIGPKRSGKGTIARVVRELVGVGNVACPTLSSLSMNFGLWPLLGKTVAMIQDARLSGRTDAAAVAERLLSISGEDAQTIDRKFLPAVTAKVYARFMLVSNELPKIADSSGALPGRMILLRLAESWYGREDIGLTGRLLLELPGILLWAIEGWQRLRDRGHFVQPKAGNEMMGEMADLSSPVGAFVRDRCRVGPACEIERPALFEEYKGWCAGEGRDHPGDSATFGRNLRAVVPAICEAQPRTDQGRVRMYRGIDLK